MLVDVLTYAGCALQLQVDLEGEGKRDVQNQESFRSLFVFFTCCTRLHTTLRPSLAVMSLRVSMNLRLDEGYDVHTIHQYGESQWGKYGPM